MVTAVREYVTAHPAQKDELQGLFTVVRRDGVVVDTGDEGAATFAIGNQ